MAVRKTGLSFDVGITDVRAVRDDFGRYITLAQREENVKSAIAIAEKIVRLFNDLDPPIEDRENPIELMGTHYWYIRGNGNVKYHRTKKGLKTYYRHDSQSMTGNFSHLASKTTGPQGGTLDLELKITNKATYTPFVVVENAQNPIHFNTWPTLESYVEKYTKDIIKIKDEAIRSILKNSEDNKNFSNQIIDVSKS